MKKIYTTSEYIIWQKRKINRPKRKYRLYNPYKHHPNTAVANKTSINGHNGPILAPGDFRLLENTESCLSFFRSIRNELNYNSKNNVPIVTVSLDGVTQVDYAAISVFEAISDDLKAKKIMLQGNLPFDTKCKQFMLDCSFLEHMVPIGKNKFPKVQKSEFVFFEKGTGVLSDNDNRRISGLVKKVVNHLTGEEKHCQPVKTIILEICGNSIEWGGTESKQWLLGVKYDIDSVLFTVTDVGRGILDTLHRKVKNKLLDKFLNRQDHEILIGAFNQKYGSNTQEVNRNKGLPAVKSNFEEGTIQDLKVLTNNVILHFDNQNSSKTFNSGSSRFKGTFYQWKMTNECINKFI